MFFSNPTNCPDYPKWKDLFFVGGYTPHTPGNSHFSAKHPKVSNGPAKPHTHVSFFSSEPPKLSI